MATTQDDVIAELQYANGALQERLGESHAERDATLAREAALAEVLDVINRSPGNLAPVFDAVLEKAHMLCGAAVGSLMTYDGEHLRVVATRGFPEGYAALIRQPFFPSVPVRTLIAGERLLHAADLRAIQPRPERLTGMLIDRTNARTGLAIPLRKDGAFLGLVCAYRTEVRPFSDKEIALLESFAVQAVIAMENARLLRELRTRTDDLQESLEYQTATSDVLKVISRSAFDLQPVLATLLETAARLCDADTAGIASSTGDKYRVVATFSNTPAFDTFIQGQSFTASRASVTGRTVLEGHIVHIADLAADPEYAVTEAVALGGVHTGLGVPLLREGEVAGVIILGRFRVEPFSDRQIELVSTFADQAVIAIENTRLITEQREALEQQTATTEVLQVINASPGNLQPVFDAMLEKAMRLCGAAFGGLSAWDGKYANVVAMRGFPPALAGYMTARGPTTAISPVIVQLSETKQLQQLPDVRAGEGYRNGHPDSRAVADLGGARTILHVPLLKDEAMLGYITVYRQEVRVFSDKEIALLENFAAQAVIAMENARLLTEQREALEQQTATAEVLQVINSSPGYLAPVFDAILEKAHRLCGATHGSLTLFDGERFRAVATYGHSEVWAERLREGLPAVNNPGTEPLLDGARFVHIVDMVEVNHTLTRAAAEATGVRTALFVPLRKENRLIGAISAHRREVRPFTEKEIALLENFAAQAVIAMENARLLTEQREALEQQTATAEVLQVINSSPGNLTPVFNAILEKAHSLCDIAYGSLELYDGEYFRSVAERGLSDDFAEMLRQGYLAAESPASRPLIDGRPFVQITHAGRIDHPVFRRAAAEHEGVRTVLFVPLRRDDTLLGMIASGRDELPFSEKEIAVLQNFAAQAVIAMENARLITEQREALEQQTATAEVLEVINTSPGNLTPVFDAMLEKAMRLCGAAFGSFYTYDGEQFLFAAQRGLPEAFAKFRAQAPLKPVPGSQLARAIENRQTLQVLDLTAEDLYREGNPFVRAMVDLGGVRTILTVPLCKDEIVLGFLSVYRQEVRAFSDKQIALLENFAAQAVIAMENARLLGELRNALDAAQATLRDLKAAQANLIQAEKMASLGQLTAGIAHEIKNPLNFVNNFAALSVDLLAELKETAAPSFAALTDDQRAAIDDVSAMLTSNLEKITEHGKRADGIVKAMLEHSRGSSAERRMVDLNAAIDDALNLAYHGARAQNQSFNITLERDFGEGIAPIEVNPQDLTRVFLNLFANGFYAATKRARNGEDTGFVPMLKITTRDAGEAVEIRVRDNGTGIPTEIRDKLFQPFFTTKPTGEGTGLGLSITYDIVTKQHGGTITVESEVDEFTEFVVTLPRQMFATEGDRL